MELNKYTWNNGTQNSPIVLTTDQIKKLILIGKREDIESNISGWITTSSRKIQKFFKYTIEQQFPNLNVVCDEELPDIFTISMSSNIIKEGTIEPININTDSGISHEFLKWKYEFTDFNIEGNISEQNIKDRIRVTNGKLIIEEPQENSSWSVTLKLIAYPIYYTEDQFNDIPAISKSDIIITIFAKKIEDISINLDSEISINSPVNVQVTPIPTDSTKLKGAKYYYSTSTPDIISINTSTAGTKIITKQVGTANLTVTLNAVNNIFNKSKSVTFNVYDLQPIRFIIDQRYKNNLSDPDDMVSANYILNAEGALKFVSNNGQTGNPSNNVITWIRKNTHAYVGKQINNKMFLKQLDDNNRKKFADGSSSIDYITDTNGNYDVFLKFNTDIYYKTEPYTPEGEFVSNTDYVLVSIAKELPKDEDESTWNKWSQYKLIGVYESCLINNKLYSLSNKIPITNISKKDHISKTKARGDKFNICDYEVMKLFALLFYGYYSSLNSQAICGYGTINKIDNKYYPKLTGLTDELAMTDTTNITGNGADSPNNEQIIAGYGDDIKSVNFWGLENYWGDLNEWVSNLRVMRTTRSSSSYDKPENYVDECIQVYGSVIITKNDGTDVVYTSMSDFLADYTDSNSKFLGITNKNDVVIRAIDINLNTNYNGYIKKIIFGTYSDILPKLISRDITKDMSFCDFGLVYNAGYHIHRSGDSNDPNGGICCLYGSNNEISKYANIGSRLIYEGDKKSVSIVNELV